MVVSLSLCCNRNSLRLVANHRQLEHHIATANEDDYGILGWVEPEWRESFCLHGRDTPMGDQPDPPFSGRQLG